MSTNAIAEKWQLHSETSLSFTFLKIFHDLSQRKSTWRTQLNEIEERRNFRSSSLSNERKFASARLQLLHAMYIKHKLSDSCSARSFLSLFITSVMFMLSFTPCLNFRIVSAARVYSISLSFCLFSACHQPFFNAKINKKMCVSHHQVCPNFFFGTLKNKTRREFFFNFFLEYITIHQGVRSEKEEKVNN